MEVVLHNAMHGHAWVITTVMGALVSVAMSGLAIWLPHLHRAQAVVDRPRRRNVSRRLIGNAISAMRIPTGENDDGAP